MARDNQDQEQAMDSRQTVELTSGESWQRLASVSLGRIVFTQQALPAIRPVNHLVDQQTIIIRSHLGAAIVAHASTPADGVVVCYEADDIDPDRHTGWSVTAIGTARLLTDPATISRYQQLLHPWAGGQKDYVIAIQPQTITGIQLTS